MVAYATVPIASLFIGTVAYAIILIGTVDIDTALIRRLESVYLLVK